MDREIGKIGGCCAFLPNLASDGKPPSFYKARMKESIDESFSIDVVS